MISDIDGKDIFFHFDDMKKTSLSKQFLKDAKNKYLIRFTFKVMAYYGKYNMSRKAVDIELVNIEPILYQDTTTDPLNMGYSNAGMVPGPVFIPGSGNTNA